MLRLGIVGIGGYAGYVCDGVLEAMAEGDGVQFVASCDPRADLQPRRRDRLRGLGIPLLSCYDRFLEQDFDAVWLPIPINLHRPFTEKALAAGKAVVVEKPAAGAIDDVDAMIVARDRSRLPVAVGFQNLFDPNAWTVKKMLLGGAIGEIQSASIIGCWPRSETYYSRNGWAGRVNHDGAWVLDSPISNALAHFVNLALFLLGPSPSASAVPEMVESELFRVYPIEMFDTCTIRATVQSDVPLLVCLTHACQTAIEPVVTINGSRGTLRFFHESNQFRIDCAGQPSRTLRRTFQPFRDIVREFGSFCGGNRLASVASLENARSHTLIVNAVSESAPVVDVPAELVQPVVGSGGQVQRTIPGIEQMFHACLQQGQLLSEAFPSSPLPVTPGRFCLDDYRQFNGPFDGAAVAMTR